MKTIIVLLGLFFAPFAMAESSLNIEVQSSDVSTMAADKYYNYNFGHVWVNQRVYADLTLTATGTAPVDIRRLVIRGSAYDAQSNCPALLPPGRTCTTRVFFWPLHEGSYYGDLIYQLADHNIFVRLYGWARR